MKKIDSFTKGLTVIGTLLVWVPILAPIYFSLVMFISARQFRFDWLMPAELFPLALVGGALLMWAATRAHSRRGLISWSLGVAVSLLVGGQALAVVTGIASGETEPAGWFMALVTGSIGAYSLAVIVIGIGGGLLLRDLIKPR